jgi:tetratricopeptide (TPR) repeat protein
MKGVWDEEFHAMDYLVYAYLQGAEDKRALGVLNELNEIRKAEPETFKVAYSYTAIPARYALERRQWQEAAKLTLAPDALGGFPWQQFPWAVAHISFARAVGMARTGDKAGARREIEKLAAIRQALRENKANYDWGKQVEIEQGIASAWLAYAEGKRTEAVRLMRAAADLDDATDKHSVTPGAILPAREQLGELLLELKDPSDALAEFDTSLRNTPNRFCGLYGAARAASLSGDREKARTYYAKLVEICGNADTDRPELLEAKAFVSGGNDRKLQ